MPLRPTCGEKTLRHIIVSNLRALMEYIQGGWYWCTVRYRYQIPGYRYRGTVGGTAAWGFSSNTVADRASLGEVVAVSLVEVVLLTVLDTVASSVSVGSGVGVLYMRVGVCVRETTTQGFVWLAVTWLFLPSVRNGLSSDRKRAPSCV
eukprot:gene24829-biopygen10252